MTFVDASKALFVKCLDFRGRSSRSEFWYAVLFSLLAGLVTGFVDAAFRIQVFNPLLSLVLFLPSLSMQVRRLHDIDRTGWWIAATPALCALALAVVLTTVVSHYGGMPPFAWAIIALAGLASAVLGIVLLVWYCTGSTDGPNRFGPHPLGNRVPPARRYE